MKGRARHILDFHLDDEGHWVAQLECGHNQHVRHNPPWQNRPWVVTAEGRSQAIGEVLFCIKCMEGAPADKRKNNPEGYRAWINRWENEGGSSVDRELDDRR